MKMSEGEKMVWATAYTRAKERFRANRTHDAERELTVAAVEVACGAVYTLRDANVRNALVEGFGDTGVLEMYDEMMGTFRVR